MSCGSILLILVALLCGLLWFPAPLGYEPIAVQIEKPKYIDELKIPLNRLNSAIYIKTPSRGPEDVEVDQNGNIYTGLEDGSLLQIDPHHLEHKVLGKFGGPILGLSLSPSEKYLAFADSQLGLGLYDFEKKTSTFLASQYHRSNFTVINAVTFASDELIYFTVSGDIPMKQFHLELLYKGRNGTVYEFNRGTNQLSIVADGLQFPNGIAYHHKHKCLYVNELNQYQVLKVQIEGSKRGVISTVANNLPGVPDNLKIAPDGNLWVGTPSIRDHITNVLDNSYWIRKLMINLRIPVWLFIKLANTKLIGGLKIDATSGQIIDYFYSTPDKTSFITSVYERHDKVYLSTLTNYVIGVQDYKESNVKKMKKQWQETLIKEKQRKETGPEEQSGL